MLPNFAYKQIWFVLYTSPSPEGFWGPKAVLLDTIYKSKFKHTKDVRAGGRLGNLLSGYLGLPALNKAQGRALISGCQLSTAVG